MVEKFLCLQAGKNESIDVSVRSTQKKIGVGKKLVYFQVKVNYLAFAPTFRRIQNVSVIRDLFFVFVYGATAPIGPGPPHSRGFYEGWNFNSGNYLFTTDTK